MALVSFIRATASRAFPNFNRNTLRMTTMTAPPSCARRLWNRHYHDSGAHAASAGTRFSVELMTEARLLPCAHGVEIPGQPLYARAEGLAVLAVLGQPVRPLDARDHEGRRLVDIHVLPDEALLLAATKRPGHARFPAPVERRDAAVELRVHR